MLLLRLPVAMLYRELSHNWKAELLVLNSSINRASSGCYNRVNTIPTNTVAREAEERHIEKALSKCKSLRICLS